MDKTSIKEYLKDNLKESRLQHTEGVVKTAMELAEKYGADVEKAEIAALCHDACRGWEIERIDMFVEINGLGDELLGNMNLAHSKCAELVAKIAFKIEDEDILNAISYHTTGREGMSLLEKIVFIADAVEPGRDYPGVEEIRAMAYENIDKACLMSLLHTKEYVLSQGDGLDETTISAIDWFEKELG